MTVAGSNGNGCATNQLSASWGLFIEKDHTIIIADSRNHRIIRWKMCDRNGQVVADGNDLGKHEVKRYQTGDRTVTLVANGNGNGTNLNQLSTPTSVFVDLQQALYVSDYLNNRVMK
ncbi:unnamed protein product [Rotaria socialis]|uniref:NHL repeat-containing protein n=1 Tax=Rotaria socialis TaxID=392032 RepID=A0A818H9W1_9BILA|nr:unnamed protein product [Rotaria socialis]